MLRPHRAPAPEDKAAHTAATVQANTQPPAPTHGQTPQGPQRRTQPDPAQAPVTASLRGRTGRDTRRRRQATPLSARPRHARGRRPCQQGLPRRLRHPNHPSPPRRPTGDGQVRERVGAQRRRQRAHPVRVALRHGPRGRRPPPPPAVAALPPGRRRPHPRPGEPGRAWPGRSRETGAGGVGAGGGRPAPLCNRCCPARPGAAAVTAPRRPAIGCPLVAPPPRPPGAGGGGQSVRGEGGNRRSRRSAAPQAATATTAFVVAAAWPVKPARRPCGAEAGESKRAVWGWRNVRRGARCSTSEAPPRCGGANAAVWRRGAVTERVGGSDRRAPRLARANAAAGDLRVKTRQPQPLPGALFGSALSLTAPRYALRCAELYFAQNDL